MLSGKKTLNRSTHSTYCLIFLALIVILAPVILVYGAPAITYMDPTLPDSATSADNWIYVNITSNETINQSFLEWGNSTGFTNISMLNNSLTNLTWYYNMTNLSAGAYNYTVWALNATDGIWNQSVRRFVTVSAISACQNIAAGNVSYTLIQNISSAGTCFNILANNIIIDGAGHTINYSQSESGYAVNNTGGYDNITIKSLNIVQGSASSSSYAILFNGSANNTISNNTIITSGESGYGIWIAASNTSTISNNTIAISNASGYGIYLSRTSSSNTLSSNTITASAAGSRGILIELSDSNAVSNNAVTTSGDSGYGIVINSSNSSTLSNNNITTSNTGAYGIYIISSYSNNISGGSIHATGASAYYLQDADATNRFTSTNFTASRNITFLSPASWFNYRNDSAQNIWLETNLSAASNITRSLTSWNSSLMQWNDTNRTAGLIANYVLTGLSADTLYHIYNMSGNLQTNSYNITTNSSGNMNFTIALNGNTEISVDRHPAISITSPAYSGFYGTNTVWANVTLNEAVVWCGYSLNGTANQTMTAASAANMSWYANLSNFTEGQKNITFYCNDTRGNMGNTSVTYFTIDTLNPIITGVTATSLSTTSEDITWTTDDVANSTVRYGLTTAVSSTKTDSANSTGHSITLTSLTEDTTYYYNVSSCDRAGNCNTSIQYSFKTAKTATEAPVEESAASANQVTSTDGLSKKWPSIAANLPETMPVSSPSVDVTQITIKLTQTIANVKLSVARVLPKPTGIASDPSGKVYQYFSVTPENVTDAKISSATISFKINATWMSQNNIDSSSIILYRYSGGKWNALSTYPAEGSTAQYKRFLAMTPGFSYFAISAQTGTSAAINKSIAPKINKTTNSTVSNNITTTSSSLSNSTSNNNETISDGSASSSTRTSLIVIISLIIAAVLAFVFREKLKINLPVKQRLNVPKFYAGQKTETSGHKYTFNSSEVKKAELVYKPKPKEEKVKYTYKHKN